jgi:hypothetical protein
MERLKITTYLAFFSTLKSMEFAPSEGAGTQVYHQLTLPSE